MNETFDTNAAEYARRALVQQQAAKTLAERLPISQSGALVDIACGPGHITAALAQQTRGRVVGVDVAGGMIEQARMRYPHIEFFQTSAERIPFENEFDVAFCNSALQWFTKPAAAIQAMHRSLKPRGKAGIACPATAQWSPFFTKVINAVIAHGTCSVMFEHWHNPWFFLPDIDAYRYFFEGAGFTTRHIAIEHETKEYSVEEAFGIYSSGAAHGFTDKRCFDIDVSDEFISQFNTMVKEEFTRRAADGKVPLDFNRLYYIGEKT